MAKNLQSKLSPRDEIRIFDIDKDAVSNLAKEMGQSQTGGAKVAIVDSARDASTEAVRWLFHVDLVFRRFKYVTGNAYSPVLAGWCVFLWSSFQTS